MRCFSAPHPDSAPSWWRVKFSVVAAWGKMFGQREAVTAEEEEGVMSGCMGGGGGMTFTWGDVLKWRRCYNIFHIFWNIVSFPPAPTHTLFSLKCTKLRRKAEETKKKKEKKNAVRNHLPATEHKLIHKDRKLKVRRFDTFPISTSPLSPGPRLQVLLLITHWDQWLDTPRLLSAWSCVDHMEPVWTQTRLDLV